MSGITLYDPTTKHEPGYATPKKFRRGDIHYELDIAPPPAFDRSKGWGILLKAECDGCEQPFLSTFNGPSRPTADTEKIFLRKAIAGTDRFFGELRKGINPYAAMISAPPQIDPALRGAVLLPSGRTETIPWLVR